MTTKAEPTHRGTLVCVVLKAKNLPNKKSIGKQDPYCTLQLGTQTQKTKPDKRGGQHPTWDEQLHFEIYDDIEDQLRNGAESTGSLTSASASSAQRRDDKKKTSKILQVACYADDAKEPEFIGEGTVDLKDTLRSGEFDEWVTIKAKDRYAGEVYLELTFYSSAAPPKKKKPSQPVVPSGTTYGGAGTFSEDFDEFDFAPKPVQKESSHAPIPSYMRPGPQQGGVRQGLRPADGSSGMTTSKSHAQLGTVPQVEDIPPSLRPSSSMAQLDTYTPPYAPPKIQRERSPAPIPSGDHRRGSFPPLAYSPSSQLYGHRLPDAAPASVIAQHYQEPSRYSQGHPTSASYTQMPSSASISTVRGNQYGSGLDAAIDDLTRPMSSMSMSTLPRAPTADPLLMHPEPGTSNYAAPPTAHQSQYPSDLHQGTPNPSAVDHFGRPTYPTAPHSYSAIPHSESHLATAPPPPPNSAPPGYQGHLQTQSGHMPSHPSQQQFNGLGRPTSPAVHAATERPHSASAYHALPRPPPQQNAPPPGYSDYHPTLEQGGPQQPGPYAPQASASRPLPPQTNSAMTPSLSSSFAPVQPGSYYPPPTQSYHGQPLPSAAQWNHSQHPQPPPSSDSYASYPPPPPGPSNGDYVHAGPQQAAPSTHPGQYPPPPAMHYIDYPQYHNAPPPPISQQPPSLSHHPSHAPPPQDYYHPHLQQQQQYLSHAQPPQQQQRPY